VKDLIQIFLAGVAGALTVSVLMGAVTLNDDGIQFPDGTFQTTAAATDVRKAFYLTLAKFNGYPSATVGPREACAQGFHMASLWEIYDVSNLRYATDAEAGGDVLRRGDSGQGPPSATSGWIRTGNVSDDTSIGGEGNCNAWETDGWGTIVRLQGTWHQNSPIERWEALFSSCSFLQSVWCFED